jgi:hypothetical protein
VSEKVYGAGRNLTYHSGSKDGEPYRPGYFSRYYFYFSNRKSANAFKKKYDMWDCSERINGSLSEGEDELRELFKENPDMLDEHPEIAEKLKVRQ